ncbi:MAG: phosphate ABC transporter, permease protein PstA, partial [Nitrospinales bacterium]
MKNVWSRGDLFIWLMGTALAICLIMAAGLLFVISVKGLAFFWPNEVTRFALKDGTYVQGETVAREEIPQPDAPEEPPRYRIKIKQGNRELYGLDFIWIEEDSILSKEILAEAVVFERLEWGNFYGV